MALSYLEGVWSWFLGSLESNKCDSMRVVSDLLEIFYVKVSNLIVKISW